MEFQVGKKVKTKMLVNEKHSIPYYHWWTITTVKEDHIVLTDCNGEIMVTDEKGKGLCPKQGHFIYKIK